MLGVPLTTRAAYAALIFALSGSEGGASPIEPRTVMPGAARPLSPIARSQKPDGGGYKLLYSFTGYPKSDGANPQAGLVDLKGSLYGTTLSGGLFGDGTVFKITIAPDKTVERVIHSFQGSPDGSNPYARLTNVAGTLYGTTSGGGSAGAGTIFTITPQGTENIVLNFLGPNGAFPRAAVTSVDGVLYGTTYQGGGVLGTDGTVFGYNPATNMFPVFYAFQGGSDGALPQAGVIDVDGTLYGTTAAGGNANTGTVFKINSTSGQETVVERFAPRDGGNPFAGLIKVDGALYGANYNYGMAYGTVFAIDPATGRKSVVYSFTGYPKDGAYPQSDLLHVNGELYGTTFQGGQYGYGSIFQINPATGKETLVYSFRGGTVSDGSGPVAALIDIDGTLYGTTSTGGAYDYGTVYSLTL